MFSISEMSYFPFYIVHFMTGYCKSTTTLCGVIRLWQFYSVKLSPFFILYFCENGKCMYAILEVCHCFWKSKI